MSICSQLDRNELLDSLGLVEDLGNLVCLAKVHLENIHAVCTRVSRALDVPAAHLEVFDDGPAEEASGSGDEDGTLRHAEPLSLHPNF